MSIVGRILGAFAISWILWLGTARLLRSRLEWWRVAAHLVSLGLPTLAIVVAAIANSHGTVLGPLWPYLLAQAALWLGTRAQRRAPDSVALGRPAA